ncbi:hypothetical protein DVH05_019678 [Phytophthora capsici]|nr:hypothetical protein DVH05_019678 [Phytophthora capsici]
MDDDSDMTQCLPLEKEESGRTEKRQLLQRGTVACTSLIRFPILVVAVSCACSPLIAYLALNTTVNELFSHAFQPNVDGSTSSLDDSNLPWVETYIHHATENHE